MNFYFFSVQICPRSLQLYWSIWLVVSTAHLLVMVTSPKEQKSPTITNRLQKKLETYFNMVIFSVYTVQNVEIISTMNARASNRLWTPKNNTRWSVRWSSHLQFLSINYMKSSFLGKRRPEHEFTNKRLTEKHMQKCIKPKHTFTYPIQYMVE